MSTKSNKSSGTQHTQRGVNQGNVLVDPITGLPVAVVTGDDGKKRLAVDAEVTATIGDVNVDLDGVGPNGDTVAIVDNVTGNKQKIEADGSTNVNVILDAASDSVSVGNTLITVPFDYIAASYPSPSVEVYIYKNGGVSGTIVGVVTVTYTDATKNAISTVAKT